MFSYGFSLGYPRVALYFLCIVQPLLSSTQAETVGYLSDNKQVLPVNQILTPVGKWIPLPGIRPQAIALSPDGRLLVTCGSVPQLLVLDPQTGQIMQRVPFPNDGDYEPNPKPTSEQILNPDLHGQLSYTGLAFSPDGRWIFLSNVRGNIKVFGVGVDGRVWPSHCLSLPPADAPRRREEIPAGLRVSSDGQFLYVCANLSNRLLVIDLQERTVKRVYEVGVAPFDVVEVGRKLYVSNWGGNRPGPTDTVGPAGRGTVVKVDPQRHIACEGTVTVIDLGEPNDSAWKNIQVGLHPSALAVSPDGRFVVCANAASDTVSVIDTELDKVVETIWAKAGPADLFGASPNAVCFSPDGKRLFVANGTQNAVAVVAFDPPSKPAKRGRSRLLGLIPVGWFPGAVVYDGRRHQIAVANIKGLPRTPQSAYGRAKGFNSRQFTGSISLVHDPSEDQLKEWTSAVYANYQRERISEALAPPRPDQPPRPVPERIGEPSTIRHVVYIIKENRTYDQVFGDMPQGNGDPSLCIFGEEITPNHHKLAREFVLLDNTYCCGILSADGHQWSTTAFSTDYMERSFCGFPRSYPDGMGIDENDALAYAPTGFIWDNAIAHSLSIFNFGEFAMPMCRWADANRPGQPEWKDFWEEFLTNAGKVIIASEPSIETIRPFTPTDYVGWEMRVPDVWRARYITNQIQRWEQQGNMPQLVLICLPNDHTSGATPGRPTPAAYVADNDLALGQIVEALSHTRFWKQMVIFVIEDDPQDGFDHVSGYRTVALVISPWAKRHATVSTLYNTTSIIRTIEQILGMRPMNQFDATATPMSDCFTDQPDYTPYGAVPNRVPLDQLNPAVSDIKDPQLRNDAIVSTRLNFDRVDACPEDVLNRIIWRAMRGTVEPYPEWAIANAGPDED